MSLGCNSSIQDELALPDAGLLLPTTSECSITPEDDTGHDYHFNDANFMNNSSPPSGNSGQLPID
jgi:hypothetical protein